MWAHRNTDLSMNGFYKLLIVFTFTFSIIVNAWAELSTERHQELIHLLKHDCGSCHGITLRGGLGPALTPDALTNKSNEALEEMIFNGLPERAMPPWGEILSREEIRWLLDRMREGVAP